MGRYIIRRLLIAVPLLLGVTVLNFLLVNLAPGDPLSRMVNPCLLYTSDAADE